MQGKKTHEQLRRTLERKPDVPDARLISAGLRKTPEGDHRTPDGKSRRSEFPISQGGMHQESEHNKHNDQGQSGHKPLDQSPAEEKR
jgi:hypothetical protein